MNFVEETNGVSTRLTVCHLQLLLHAQRRKNEKIVFFIENDFNPPPATARPGRAMRLTAVFSRLPIPFSGHVKRSGQLI